MRSCTGEGERSSAVSKSIASKTCRFTLQYRTRGARTYFLALQLRLSRAESRLKCHFSYRLASGEHGFPFQDRFPGFDIFVIDSFRAASDRVNREFVEYSEYARGDPIANACEMAQTFAR